jgi:chromosome segregation ATPase
MHACFQAYNQGQDEYPDQLEELYWDLIGNMGVDEDLIQQLEQDLEDIKAEHKALEKDTSGLAGLEDEAARVSSDIHGLQEFLEKQKRYKDQNALDLKTTKENVEVLLQKMDDLKESIEALEADCRTKGIDPNDTSNHIEDMVLALQVR